MSAATNVPRDPIAELIRYNSRFRATGMGADGAGREARVAARQLDRMTASPFGLLRGSFHLFVMDWVEGGETDLLGSSRASQQPIVGDLHLENFGAFRAADGRYVFDINDFDETGPGSPAIDLCRLATSIVLADEKHGVARAAARIVDMVSAYLAGARTLDLRAIDKTVKNLPAAVTQVLQVAEDSSRPEWLAARVEGPPGARKFKQNEKYTPITDEAQRAAITAGVREFARGVAARLPEVASWATAAPVLDIAVRIAGTGSLGRLRYAVLLSGKNDKVGKELILELKEAIPSSLTPNDTEDQAVRVIETMRALQGDSPAYLGVAHVGGRSFAVRELSPMEGKISSADLQPSQLDELAPMLGSVLGRLHRRGSPMLGSRLDGRDRSLARRVTAFGLRYADQVSADHAELVARRGEVEAALGLVNP